MIKPICDKCKSELTDSWEIILSPPDANNNNTRKFHLYKECYNSIIKENNIN